MSISNIWFEKKILNNKTDHDIKDGQIFTVFRFFILIPLPQVRCASDVPPGPVHRPVLRHRQTDPRPGPYRRGARPVWSHPHALSRPPRPEECVSCSDDPAPLPTGPPSVAETQPQRWVVHLLY